MKIKKYQKGKIIEGVAKGAERVANVLNKENLTSRVKAAVERIPKLPDKGFEGMIGFDKNLRNYLIKEGVDPEILTDDVLKKLTYGRFSALSSATSSANDSKRFAVRMPIRTYIDND